MLIGCLSNQKKSKFICNDIEPRFTGEPKFKGKYETAAELGFDSNQVKRFETLADNPDLVEQMNQFIRHPSITSLIKIAHRSILRVKNLYITLYVV
jgi:hypothetical protein